MSRGYYVHNGRAAMFWSAKGADAVGTFSIPSPQQPVYTLRPRSSANGRTWRSPTDATEALPCSNVLAACKPLAWGVSCHTGKTYRRQLISRHRLQRLENLGNLERLDTANQAGARVDEPRPAGLAGRQEVELGLGNGLDHILLRNLALGDALQNLDRLLRRFPDGTPGARDLDGEETAIRVRVVGSLGLRAGVRRRDLGEDAEAGRPLDRRLAAEEADQNSGFGAAGAEGGAGEGDDDRVETVPRDARLSAVVFGRIRAQRALGLGGDLLEEGLEPLLKTTLAGTVGNDGDVGLGVGRLGESGDVVLVQVGPNRRFGGRVERVTEASVEGDGVGGIERDAIVADLGLLLADDALDLLVKLVGCVASW